MSTATATPSTTVRTITVETHGLSDYAIESAIYDAYIAKRIRQRDAERKAETKERVTQRNRHLNAIKRAGLSIRVESDSYRTRKDVALANDAKDGWWQVTALDKDALTVLVTLQKANDLEVEERIETIHEWTTKTDKFVRRTYIRLTTTTETN